MIVKIIVYNNTMTSTIILQIPMDYYKNISKILWLYYSCTTALQTQFCRLGSADYRSLQVTALTTHYRFHGNITGFADEIKSAKKSLTFPYVASSCPILVV
jgi:hypothetical protein